MSITQTRHKTHGSFAENAEVSQHIKDLLRSRPGYSKLTNVQRESVDMIALKLSRIVSGKAGEKDHWVDIGGYADLAVQEIEG